MHIIQHCVIIYNKDIKNNKYKQNKQQQKTIKRQRNNQRDIQKHNQR